MDDVVRRWLSLSAATCGVLLVVGCGGTPAEPSPGDIAADVPATSEPEPVGDDDAPSPAGGASALGRYLGPDDLSFETSEDLSPELWTIEWMWQFDPATFDLEDSDSGGMQVVTDRGTGCTIALVSGRFDLESRGDDRILTDDFLVDASQGALTDDIVAMHAYDDSMPRPGDPDPSASAPGVGDHTVPMRTIAGAGGDGEEILYSARAFGAAGSGLLVYVECPPGASSQDEYERLKGEMLVVLVYPTIE